MDDRSGLMIHTKAWQERQISPDTAQSARFTRVGQLILVSERLGRSTHSPKIQGVPSKSRAIFLVQRWMVGSFHGITTPLTKRVPKTRTRRQSTVFWAGCDHLVISLFSHGIHSTKNSPQILLRALEHDLPGVMARYCRWSIHVYPTTIVIIVINWCRISSIHSTASLTNNALAKRVDLQRKRKTDVKPPSLV